MKAIITAQMLCAAVLFFAVRPLYAADIPDARSVPLEVNLIIDGSAALASVQENVTAWVSGNLLDRVLQPGDKITVWSAGGTAEIVYQDTLKDAAGKETIKKALKSLSAKGETADFAGALRDAASRSRAGSYTVLVSASAAALSPALLGPQANLLRFSRVEEFKGWRAMVIALGIESKVRQAAAAWLSGN